MSVVDREHQYKVLIEAVQNHSPDVLIVDEIGRTEEVDVIRMISKRGVRIVGTARGPTLLSTLFNPDISDLVGGLKATERTEQTKTKAIEIAHDPPFSCLIDLRERNHFRIFHNIRKAVTELLEENKCVVEERWLENKILRSKFTYYKNPEPNFDEIFELHEAIKKERRRYSS